jgi:multiple sugar transport system permease protein
MMRQYFRGLPKELEEAAYVDGAGTIKAFVRVFLASARQIMMTVFLFSFVWQWLDDIFTSVFLQNVPMLTTELFRLISNSAGVDAGISNLTEFSLMRNCGMLFLIIPMLILYLFCQRYFTESIERAGLVG